MKRLYALASVLAAVWVAAEALAPGTDDEIRARIAPFGSSCMEEDEVCGDIAAPAPPVTVAEAPAAPLSGKEVYDRFCFACHATGVGEAPLLQNAEQWAPRLAKGMDAMLQTSLTGMGAMPPMGACMACSEEEMTAAIEYLIGS